MLLTDCLVAQTASPLWFRTHSSQVPSLDMGRALTEDANHDVIVLSELRRNSLNTLAPLLQKFNPQGNLLWEAPLPQTSQSRTIPVDVATDSTNHIYILAETQGLSAGATDLLLLKYDPQGALLWTATYNGPASGKEEAKQLHVQPNGVTTLLANSENANGFMDLLILRYDQSGTQGYDFRWPSNPNEDENALHLKVDAAGNAYASEGQAGNGFLTPVSHVSLVKVTANGGLAWDTVVDPLATSRYQEAGLELDLQGDVYLSRIETAGTASWLNVMKLDSSGMLQATHQGLPYQNADLMTYQAILGPDSALYYAFMELNLFGGIPFNHLYKLDRQLNFQWDQYIDTNFTADILQLPDPQKRIMAAMPNGHLLLVGQTRSSSASGAETLFLEYDGNGIKQGSGTWRGAGNGKDLPFDFVVQDTHQVWLTGYATEAGSNRDALALKYDLQTGNHQASYRDSLVPGSDELVSLKQDAAGNLYAGGYAEGEDLKPKLFLVKFDPAGNVLWDTLFNDASSRKYYLKDMLIGPGGNLYLLATGDIFQGPALFLIIMDPNGQVLQTVMVPPDPGRRLNAQAMAWDGNNRIYLSAIESKPASPERMHIYAYDPNGNQVWQDTYIASNTSTFGSVEKLVVLNNGIMAGFYMNAAYHIRRLDVNGNLVYQVDHPVFYVAANHYFDGDSQGNAFFCVRTLDSLNGGTDWLVTKYDSTGSLDWETQYRIDVPGLGEPQVIAVNAQGEAMVGGFSNYAVSAPGLTNYGLKLDPNGSPVISLPLSPFYQATAGLQVQRILPTPGGGMLLAGCQGSSFANRQLQVSNVHGNGFLNWTYLFQEPGHNFSVGYSLLTGPGGDLYVAGITEQDSTHKDFLLLKFDQATDREAEIESQDCFLYPQPARDQVMVEWSGFVGAAPTEVQIIDAQGKSILHKSLSAERNTSQTQSIKLPTLSPGLYFITLDNHLGQRTAHKLLIQ